MRSALLLATVFVAINIHHTPAISQNIQKSAAEAPSEAFQAFGGKPGLQKLMDDFMLRLLADTRMATFFKDVNQARVKEQLVEQFCAELGGGCIYKGADMKSSHANFDITKADFNRLVEVLQASMAAQGIPFRAQTTLLAKLAPMHRDVITVRPGQQP
jgi:hemoglobin